MFKPLGLICSLTNSLHICRWGEIFFLSATNDSFNQKCNIDREWMPGWINWRVMGWWTAVSCWNNGDMVFLLYGWTVLVLYQNSGESRQGRSPEIWVLSVWDLMRVARTSFASGSLSFHFWSSSTKRKWPNFSVTWIPWMSCRSLTSHAQMSPLSYTHSAQKRCEGLAGRWRGG